MISFVIPTLNEKNYLERTLTTLRELSITPREIIVSDGNSKDGTIAIAKKLADKIVVYEGTTRVTIGRGKNDGAKVAIGDYLVFLDADVIIPNPNLFFEKALAYFEKDPNLVGLCVRLKVEPKLERVSDKLVFALVNAQFFIANNISHNGSAAGEFQMIRTEAFKQVGGYHQNLPIGEDADMFQKLGKIGRTYFAPTLTVYQSGRRLHKEGWLKVLYQWMKNAIYLYLFKKSAYKEWEPIR